MFGLRFLVLMSPGLLSDTCLNVLSRLREKQDVNKLIWTRWMFLSGRIMNYRVGHHVTNVLPGEDWACEPGHVRWGSYCIISECVTYRTWWFGSSGGVEALDTSDSDSEPFRLYTVRRFNWETEAVISLSLSSKPPDSWDRTSGFTFRTRCWSTSASSGPLRVVLQGWGGKTTGSVWVS